MKIKKLLSNFFERIMYGGYTYEEACIAAGGGGGGKGGSSQRQPTKQELALWETQAGHLELLGQIAENQYGLSVEDRDYYTEVFRSGDDTQAKNAIAELQSRITGTEIDPNTIKNVSIDTLLRDTILNTTPEFQKAAADVIGTTNTLTEQFGSEVSGLSKTFAQGVQDLTTKYSSDLEAIKGKMGTADEDILAAQTGAATGGISQGFAEARKQIGSDLARRGLAGSGVEAQILSQAYQQEAMAKGQAMFGAHQAAIQQSDMRRQGLAQLSQAQLQAGMGGLGTAYQAQSGAAQNIYGAATQQAYQAHQTQNAAALQGIAGLTQVAQAGQGLYAGAQNYSQLAAGTAGQGASISGSSATGLANVNNQYTMNQQNMEAEMFGSLVGGGLGMFSFGF